jgi:hypothetical protein
MKKLLLALLGMPLLLATVGCGNSAPKVPFDNGDSLEIVNRDPTIYGICGVGTSMNSLQLIDDTGDTLLIDITAAREANQVFGGLQVGDRMVVMPGESDTEAAIVINQSTLLGNWIMPNPLDGSDELGVCIKEGGVAESIAQSTLIYHTWRLTRGQLEFVVVREGGSEEEETELYSFVKLTADSLVFRDSEEVFEYSRQRPKEEYGSDVEIEHEEFTF